MNLKHVAFDDENHIDYEFFLETTGENSRWYTLIAKFSGRYRNGSSGKPDAYFINGLTLTAFRVWHPAAIILDISELQYDWGDDMALVLDCYGIDHVPSVVVVGPGCDRAIATLMWGTRTERVATEAEGIFDNIEEAWEHVRKTSK